MTIPSSTLDILSVAYVSAHAIRYPAHDEYAVDGNTLNHIEALILRLNDPRKLDADERRDWANVLRLLIDGAKELDQ